MINAVILTLVFDRDFPLWFAVIVVFRDLSFIIFGYSLFRGRDIVLKSNWWGKTTAFFLGVLLFLYVGFSGKEQIVHYQNILLGICLTLIVGSAINYLNRFIRAININSNNKE